MYDVNSKEESIQARVGSDLKKELLDFAMDRDVKPSEIIREALRGYLDSMHEGQLGDGLGQLSRIVAEQEATHRAQLKLIEMMLQKTKDGVNGEL